MSIVTTIPTEVWPYLASTLWWFVVLHAGLMFCRGLGSFVLRILGC